jgi:N-acetylneuraminate synthase
MHCVSTYPMKPEDANLNTILALKEKFNCDVGYSGHENGVVICLAIATFFNISSLERHITLDRTMYGSDQAASLELSGMKQLVSSLEKIIIAIGKNKLGNITDEEKIIAKKLRAHIK